MADKYASETGKAEKIAMPTGEIQVSDGDVFSFPTHTHSYFEMTLYRPFDGCIYVNNKEVEIDRPTAILICPLDFHRIKVNRDGSARFIKICFGGSVFADESEIPHSSVIMRGISEGSFTAAAFDEALRFSGDRVYLAALVRTIVCRLLADGHHVMPSSVHGYRTAADAVRIINEDFRSKITLSSVAKSLSVTPQYLSSLFKSVLGTGFSRYLSDMRLRCAERLLSESDMPVTEICFECGYGNLSHFLRTFKAATGLTPLEYRKKHGGESK